MAKIEPMAKSPPEESTKKSVCKVLGIIKGENRLSKCWLISVCRFRGEISQFVSPCDTNHCTTSRLPLLHAQWIRLRPIAVLCSSINHQLMHIGQLENSDCSQRPMENSFHNQIAQQEQMTAHSGRSVDIVGCRSLRHHFVVIGRT